MLTLTINLSPVGLIESLLTEDNWVAVAAMLDRSRAKREVMICCINLSFESRELQVGIIISVHQSVKKVQIERINVWENSVLPGA